MTTEADRVLVTGADGFIGTALCRQLTAAGCDLVRLTRSRRQSPNSDLADADSFALGSRDFSGDIRDGDLLDRAMQGVNVVFHLAGLAHVDSPDPTLLQTVNVEGSAAVASAAVRAGVGTLVFFSSSLAEAAEQGRPDATAYGHAKYLAEQRLREIADQSALQLIILRPVAVYGPGMKGNLAALIRLIRRRRLPPLPRFATRYSLVGLHDLCRVALLAAQKGSIAAGTWPVTDGVEYPLNAIETAIYQALGRNPPRWHSPRALFYLAALGVGALNRLAGRRSSLGLRTYQGLVRDSVFSNRELCERLGFTPQQSFYTALPSLIDIK